jgi:integrase/recombinase XerD
MVSRRHRSPDRRSKPLYEWPERDRDLWLAALRPGDLFEDGGELSRRSEFTARRIAAGYGRWLTWLEIRGVLHEKASPGDRITPARVRDYLAALEQHGNATHTIITRIIELAYAARIMDPQRNWSWISKLATPVRARHRPARPKRHRLVPTRVLFDLGLRLMSESHHKNGDRRLAEYRHGLQIALLAARPLRMRNLAGLALDQNLVRRGDTWWIEFAATETKTKEPIELPWPDQLVPQLEYYLSQIRPALAAKRGRSTRPVGNALWVSTNGSPMSRHAIYSRIVMHTRAALGHAINPHLFRDCAATSVAIDDPAHVGIASRLLGHRTYSTTERHYNQARAVEACRLLQGSLLSLRRRRSL